jgi:chaperone BCS1
LDPALLRPGRIDRKIQYYLATKTQAEALFIKFYPASHTTLNSELSTSPSDPNVLSKKTPAVMHVSERQSALAELAKEFASHVPEHELSTAELQGYLLMCRKSPERAVSGISEWVEVERKERKERNEKEEERKKRLKEKKEAKEAERLQDSLTRIGGTVVIAPPGANDASLSTVVNGEGNTGSVANASPTSPVLTTEASSEMGGAVPADDASASLQVSAS